jgi:class 3 adenylate cyclase/TolB-like protein
MAVRKTRRGLEPVMTASIVQLLPKQTRDATRGPGPTISYAEQPERERVERRLTAILAADVVGYSRLIGADEEGTLAALKAVRRELVDPAICEHRGRLVKTIGDGLLIEFASVVDAVRFAVALQREMAARNTDIPAELRIEFRIGINLGDIVVEDGDIFGDGVNVAARLEGLADPGGVCVSRGVRNQVRDKLALQFEDMGERRVKNIARPVRVHRIVLAGTPRPAPGNTASSAPEPTSAGRQAHLLAVLPFQNIGGDPEQEQFADGLVEEITLALAQTRRLSVLAHYPRSIENGSDARQLGRDLGVGYVVEGSVRQAGRQLRVGVKLIDALTGTHLWAARFEGDVHGGFELQDTVARRVADVVATALVLMTGLGPTQTSPASVFDFIGSRLVATAGH